MVRRRTTAPKAFTRGNDATTKSLAAVAGKFSHFRPAPEVLKSVEAVRTIFPQFDSAVKVGGFPTSRFTLVHGPSNEGKTTFALGAGLSFLRGNHFFGLADAERTTPPEWLVDLMGSYSDHPCFSALPVRSYEQTVDGVRNYCETIAEAREKGQIPEETRGLVAVDSLRKLVPKKVMKELFKGSDGDAKKGVDGFGGRAGQMKAALNAAWVDELIPLLADTKMSMIVIARETEDPNAGMFDDAVRVGGGKAVFYDSSLALRISRKFIRNEDNKSEIYGERHCIEVRKTKVAKKEASNPKAFFHTSNGVLSPAGFDLARDLIELGKATGIVSVGGSWYSYDTGEKSGKLGQGLNGALRKLAAEPDLLNDLEAAIRDVAQ